MEEPLDTTKYTKEEDHRKAAGRDDEAAGRRTEEKLLKKHRLFYETRFPAFWAAARLGATASIQRTTNDA